MCDTLWTIIAAIGTLIAIVGGAITIDWLYGRFLLLNRCWEHINNLYKELDKIQVPSTHKKKGKK